MTEKLFVENGLYQLKLVDFDLEINIAFSFLKAAHFWWERIFKYVFVLTNESFVSQTVM